jgi:hypothetical protein
MARWLEFFTGQAISTVRDERDLEAFQRQGDVKVLYFAEARDTPVYHAVHAVARQTRKDVFGRLTPNSNPYEMGRISSGGRSQALPAGHCTLQRGPPQRLRGQGSLPRRWSCTCLIRKISTSTVPRMAGIGMGPTTRLPRR